MREPGGNRIEACSGGYHGFDPDDHPVGWMCFRVPGTAVPGTLKLLAG